jgi:hypothetical protein
MRTTISSRFSDRQGICALARHITLVVALTSTMPTMSADRDNTSAIWFQLGALSYHPNREHSYNERNVGGGVEYQFNHRHLVAVGVYENSYFDTTHYAYYVWRPIEFNDVNLLGIPIRSLRFGALAGLFDGYRRRNDGDLAPIVLPVVTVEWRYVGLNITAFPQVGDVDGGVAVQLKVRF